MHKSFNEDMCFMVRWRRGEWHRVPEVSVDAVEPFDAGNADEYVPHGWEKGQCVAELLEHFNMITENL
ncbi:hypothetical protein SASPL_146193 [Salvia splendens]|uniref:Uncharacterized protein n=1 Tax=Salvia splendens TaxID=180675 RepID=A0A8X8Z4Y7_SALSN|nr:hypothetical protein SASPL_146193 [Salvia splendens]